MLKSKEDLLRKRERGGAMSATSEGRKQRYVDMAFFDYRDRLVNREYWAEHEWHAQRNAEFSASLGLPEETARSLALLMPAWTGQTMSAAQTGPRV
jgi:hypothetical protein